MLRWRLGGRSILARPLRQQLESEIRQKHPKYADLKYPTPLKLEAIQGLLDDHTALLEYSLGQDGSFMFVVSKEGLRSYRLPPAAEINWLVQEVRSAMARPGRRELGRFVGASRKLYDLLIAPAADTLKGKRQLLIAPDSALYYLPFEALLTASPTTTEQRDLAYLLKQWAHGLISERMPQHSGLVVTLDADVQEDGLLQVYEIFNLKLSADLVVLSACRTGLGKEVRGEGVIGLTRAFMYAGASSLIVSLWQVADQSTSELMIHFYEQMNAGNVKTEALRRAKLKMIKDSRYFHPYYWAPFVLTGEPK